MPAPQLFCRTATAFSPDGAIDEDAFRKYLQRFIDARIGVDACKGKIPVHGNPPEKLSVRETLDHINLAIAGGVEIVNIYGPAAWHGFRPTDEEVFAFFRGGLCLL